MFIAASVVVSKLPLEPSSTITFATVSLSGASSMVRKSYFPRRAYCFRTFAPIFSISLLTSFNRSGLLFSVFLPSAVSRDSTTNSDNVFTLIESGTEGI